MAIENLSCANCGAPLPSNVVSDVVRCEYCGNQNRIKQGMDGRLSTELHRQTVDLLADLASKKQLERRLKELNNEKESLDERKKAAVKELKAEVEDRVKREAKKITTAGYVAWFFYLSAIGALVFNSLGSVSRDACIVIFPVGLFMGFIFNINNNESVNASKRRLRSELMDKGNKTIQELDIEITLVVEKITAAEKEIERLNN